MSNQWLRLWHDMPNDPKWRTIANKSGQKIGDVMAVYMHHLVSASMNNPRGVTQCNAEDVSTALDLNIEQVEAINAAMQGRVLNGNHLSGWEERQPKREDNSSDRVKSYRERNAVKRDVTQCNPREDTEEDKDKNTTHTAHAEVSDFQKIYEAGSAVFPSLAIANTSFIQMWISAGCAPLLDAVPAIQAAHLSGKDVKSWKYFDGAVREAIERRKNPQAKGNANETNRRNFTKPSFTSAGNALADKYAREAELEEQAEAGRAAGTNLCIAESIRKDP